MSLKAAIDLSQEKPVVVMFSANWCGPCKVVKPVLTRLKEQTDDWHLMIIDIDNNLQDAITMGIRGVPTIYLFHGGVVVERFVGAPSGRMLNQWLSKHITDKIVN